MTTIYRGAVGLRVRVQTSLDLLDLNAAASIHVKKPDGTVAEWDAEVEAPASGGVIYHDTEAGDLDQTGSYRLQAEVQRTGDTDPLPLGETATLEVHEPFE